MKCSLISVLSIICNVLLTQGQINENGQNSDITQVVNYKSILEDINEFYQQKQETGLQISNNPNIKAQLNGNGVGNNNLDSNSSIGDNNSKTSDNSNTNTNTNSNSNSNGNNNNSNGNLNTFSNNNNDNNNNNNNNNDNGDNNNKDGNSEKTGDDDEENIVEIPNMCNSLNRASLGMFAFHKPVKRSILVINSNFTIIWSFAGILDGYEYNFPNSNITLKLYEEEDSNPNTNGNTWDSPVFERTIPLTEVEEGPVIDRIRTYKYNWFIIPTIEEGFKKTPISNKKYRFRIYGDGKDDHSQPGFDCYSNGDIQPGLTVPFYLVENTPITMNYYKPIAIEDDARMNANMSLFTTIIITMLLILYYHW